MAMTAIRLTLLGFCSRLAAVGVKLMCLLCSSGNGEPGQLSGSLDVV